MKKKGINWNSQFRDLQRRNTGITGQIYPVRNVEPGQEDQLGYTSSKKSIHLNPFHPLLDDLDDINKVALVTGVDAHELLHQIFTDFAYFERKMVGINQFERPIFAVINNVLEDCAIEGFADQVMGGTMLASLNYSIAYIYSKSPEISEARTPFSQYIAALINFGDMGPLKGNFTFPEARKAFIQTAPLFEQGVYETVGKKRIEIAYQIMQMTRPLWEEDVKKNEEMAKLLEDLAKRFKSQMRGSGSGQDADESSDDGKRSARRKITIKKVSKEELEEMKKNGEISEPGEGGSGELPDGDITLIVCEDEESDEKNSSGGVSISMDGEISEENGEESSSSESGESAETEESEDKDGEGKGESGEKSDEDSEKDSDGDSKDGEGNESDKDSKKDPKESKPDNSGNKNNPFTTPMGQPDQKIGNEPMPAGFEESDEANGIGEISDDEYVLSEEDMKRIKAEIEKAEEEMAKEEAAEAETSAIDDFNVTSPKLGKKSCLNYRVSYDSCDHAYLEEKYAQTMSKLSPGIKNLTTQLKRIFENDYEETEYRTSGRINLKRANSGRVTARVFDRRIAPSNKSNFCVELLVDESGSMSSGNKATSARECCIALSEVFANLHIPVYVIGFTADTKGHDIVHNHYITWKNTHNERLKLLNITARANNCDGYSIRYATEVLKKSKAENKLLIVLSDGQPAASGYYDGVADTKQAIRDAKKHSNVLGVAIGNSDTETIFHMYEKDFLHVGKVDDLFSGLSKQLQKMMKNWGDR